MPRTASAPPTTRPLTAIGAQELAVLKALLENRGRVLSRSELSRRAGLSECSHRRCDGVLVGVRRALGPDSIVTVRRRGWMLSDDGVPAALAVVNAEQHSATT
jgi:DNA-binding winged helix-turn-helix (wHTH) protein